MASNNFIINAGATLTIENSDKIYNKIMTQFVNYLNKRLPRALNNLKPLLSELIVDYIKLSPEYKELVGGGKLLGELGIPDVQFRLDELIDIWKDEVFVHFDKFTRVGNNIKGMFRINMVWRGLDYALQSNVARYDYFSNKQKKVIEIPWLEWLTMAGDQVLVQGYEVKFSGFEKQRSRTGLALMVRELGATWRVPPKHSGTIDNNFITRALKRGSSDILLNIEAELEKTLI